ncbi:hypothetical protein C8D70_102216 [Chryseobacterium sp. CBTAP 102]|uniref:hypothetical protein n=1 Tax=Chryseobacterium sp. CBTAP 102 TaxID=2135644 RepID=UPI000D773F1E|nr:hypothetical protein [Chryseobacterium sp. CBTAP 102]PXW17154.1 hypothetical protein C8D70_102216 [Chryseobacterium sp. CBTAP 102]
MIFPKAKKIARDLGWYKTGDGIFGLYKGYFFNVSDASIIHTPQYKSVSVTTGNLTEEQRLKIKTELTNNRKRLKFTLFEVRENSIYFKFTENIMPTKIRTVYALFDFLADLLKKLNIPEQNKCHSCEKLQRINYYDLNHTGILLCDDCFKQMDNKFYEIEKERVSKEKNYLTGFLGAVIFSIPAIILWVLLAVYLGGISSGMAFVTALLGFLGYDYFNGFRGKLTRSIIFFTSIISIFVANIITVIALFVKGGFSITEAISEFQTNPAANEIFMRNIIVSFILSCIPWIWILFIRKDNQLVIKPAEKF